MKNEVDISVIVLTYFHEEYVVRAVNSVLNQQFSGTYEIIVSDDFSGDNTLILVNEIQKKYPDIVQVIEHKTNVGTCKNIYDAFMNAKGRYIVIMAGDDELIDEYKLEKQFSFLENKDNESYAVVATPIKTVFTDGEDTGEVYPAKKYWNKEFTVKQFLAGENYTEQGMMIRNIFSTEKAKEQFKLLYKFSRLVEDLTLNFFMYDYGSVYILPDITYALTVRRQNDKNQHNYNSIRSNYEKITDHINLLNNINDYYEGKYNLQKRYYPFIGGAITTAIKGKNLSYLRCLHGVSPKYILPSCVDYIISYIKRKRKESKAIS